MQLKLHSSNCSQVSDPDAKEMDSVGKTTELRLEYSYKYVVAMCDYRQ